MVRIHLNDDYNIYVFRYFLMCIELVDIILFAGNCDNCTSTKRERDMSKEAFLLLACIMSCKGKWGLNMSIDILRGSRVSFQSLGLPGTKHSLIIVVR